MALAPAKSSTSWPRVYRTTSICVNLLSAEQESVARRFAQSGGDKFNGVGWTAARNGAPRIDGALAWIDCNIEEVHEAGDHWLVVARVVALETSPGSPLLFYRGGFGNFTT